MAKTAAPRKVTGLTSDALVAIAIYYNSYPCIKSIVDELGGATYYAAISKFQNIKTKIKLSELVGSTLAHPAQLLSSATKLIQEAQGFSDDLHDLMRQLKAEDALLKNVLATLKDKSGAIDGDIGKVGNLRLFLQQESSAILGCGTMLGAAEKGLRELSDNIQNALDQYLKSAVQTLRSRAIEFGEQLKAEDKRITLSDRELFVNSCSVCNVGETLKRHDQLVERYKMPMIDSGNKMELNALYAINFFYAAAEQLPMTGTVEEQIDVLKVCKTRAQEVADKLSQEMLSLRDQMLNGIDHKLRQARDRHAALELSMFGEKGVLSVSAKRFRMDRINEVKDILVEAERANQPQPQLQQDM